MRNKIAFSGSNPWGIEANFSIIFDKNSSDFVGFIYHLHILLTYTGENAIIIIIDTLD